MSNQIVNSQSQKEEIVSSKKSMKLNASKKECNRADW